MLYVPNIENYKCVVVRSEQVIRAYKEVPTNNSTIDYDDYYIQSNYISQPGQQAFSNYTQLPTCIDDSYLTDDWLYMVDSYQIFLIIISILIIIGMGFKLMFRFFRRLN